MHHFVRVEFSRFKAFRSFAIDLKRFNVLVGPNNAGKSTILAAFRILAAAMRKAATRKAELVSGPYGIARGYTVDISATSVAGENIFYNYDYQEPASINFKLSNKNSLTLTFPEPHVCFLFLNAQGKFIETPSAFNKSFDCRVGFVPILGPVEHHELLYEKEAARLALFNYTASRNFRNIWYHYPDHFDEFRRVLRQTWPGMDIEPPEVDRSHPKPRLHMYCPEQRIPRELFWSGFGFQVWCQMLTHLLQAKNVSLFLVDEPDIYLHSELQRQLLGLLRDLGPDILIATHSTEIITEAETDDIVLINKNRQSARRIRDPSQVQEAFHIIGSNLNPTLTQLAKTRRALFVEGKDFQILGRFARKLGLDGVGNGRDFAVVPVEGFNPERIRSLKAGMEATLGSKILAAAIFDKDYRCFEECIAVEKACSAFCKLFLILDRKEIENFLLVPTAIDRAIKERSADRAKRSGETAFCELSSAKILDEFSEAKRSYVTSRILAGRRLYLKTSSPEIHEAQTHEDTLKSIDKIWDNIEDRLKLIPGKEAIAHLSKHAQENYKVSLTTTAIIGAMRADEVPNEMRTLVGRLADFSTSSTEI